MKKMKKICAMLLAFTMVFSMSVVAMAEETIIGDSDDKGTITVSGIDQEDGISVTAYQIVKANYQNGGSFSGYEVSYPEVASAISLTPDTAGNVSITRENLNAIISEIVALDKVASGTTYSLNKAEGSDDYVAEVPVGSYLVVISGAEAKIYSPIVVSVNYIVNEENGGTNQISSGIVEIENGIAWVKESTIPAFAKIEEDASGNTHNDFNLGNSIDAGNDVNYKLTIDSIPFYGGEYPVFRVLDTIQSGLTYGDTFEVYVDGDGDREIVIKDDSVDKLLMEDTDYTIDVGEQSFVIDFVVEDAYALNDYEGSSIIIKYSATLETADNNYNFKGYRNDATLTFTYDSKVGDAEVIGTKTEETYTYTFELTNNIVKVNEEKRALEGAYFTLKTLDNQGEKVDYNNALLEKETITVNNVEYSVLKTDANGQLAMKGLEAGTYYLEEVKAPKGYSVNTHEFVIEVEAEYEADGQLKTYTVEVDGTKVGTGENAFEIPNTKLMSLPSTGGIGTTIFTITGCAIMIAAAFMFIVSRRKETK